MPNGWDVYYIVFLSAFLALGIPAVLAVVSFVVSPRIKNRKQQPANDLNAVLSDATQSNETVLGQKMNARFFLAANAALILIALMLALVPCIGMLQPGGGRESVVRGLIAIVTIAGFAALGLLYSARKSDLSWLKGFNRGSGRSK